MEICPYLAMTAAEIAARHALPEKIAYMACHFSPYSTGLSNIPGALPLGSLLMVNDRTPIGGHDPGRILEELGAAVERMECSGIVLDFQRPDYPETAELCKSLVQGLSCPVCVSHLYATELPCPVLIPPVPLDVLPEEYLSRWQGREIWLEIATDAARIRVTRQGAAIHPEAYPEEEETMHPEPQLHIAYRIEQTEDALLFHLRRSPAHLDSLLRSAQALGIHTAIGLYQQLYQRK